MEDLIIEIKGNQIILKINKKGFDKNYLIALLKRLKIENLAQKSEFEPQILGIAEQINKDWWDKNGEEFLSGVKR